MSRGLDRRKAEAALERAAHKAIHGTREERSGRVISSALAHVAYSGRTRELDVRFVSGRTYRYFDVPPEVYERLREAASKGVFFNTAIKDKYDCREI
jgi:lysyl-tRNA synthetase class 2